MKLKDVAAAVGCPYTGDGEVDIQAVKSAEKAGPADITFIMDRKHRKLLESTQAAAVIIPEDFPAPAKPAIRSRNSHLTFAQVLGLFYQPPLPAGPFIHPTAVLGEGVTMGPDCYIGAHAVIGDGVQLGRSVRILPNCTIYPGVEIGDNSLIHANCVIREFCRLGRDVILQNGVVLGADGFGFAKASDGAYHKIPQAGRVILDDGVEIQANTCVDRGTLDDTIIGRGTKLDNLIQIGHGCEIGRDCVMAGQVGLAGSTKVGDNAMFGGQVGIGGHCAIGNNVILMAQSGIMASIEDNSVLAGSPAVEHRHYFRITAVLSKLPELLTRLRALEQDLGRLKKAHE